MQMDLSGKSGKENNNNKKQLERDPTKKSS